jgi:hypothetical protein
MNTPAERYEIGANGEADSTASQIHAAALAAAELAKRRPTETVHVYDRQAKAGTVCLWNWDRSRGELTPVARKESGSIQNVVPELPAVSLEKLG